MAHNVCCDSYHAHNVTYLLHYCTCTGVTYVTCVSVLFPGTVVLTEMYISLSEYIVSDRFTQCYCKLVFSTNKCIS